MPDDREQLREIAGNEVWLSQNIPAEPPVSLEHLKLRVRVELGEQWLRSQLPPAGEPVCPELSDRIRARVFESKRVVPIQIASRKWQTLVGAGMSLAAVVTLGILLARNADVAHPPIPFDVDEFVFEEEAEDVDWELGLLEDELVELGEEFALGNEPGWDDLEPDFDSDSRF